MTPDTKDLSSPETHLQALEFIAMRAFDCEAAAVAAGFEGGEYLLEAGDLEYITREFQTAFGRLPTKQEWRDAGWASVPCDAYEG